MRYVLVLLAFAPTPPHAYGRDREPPTSGRTAGSEPASNLQPAPDLAWLDRILEMLRSRATTRQTLAGFFGVDPADAASDEGTVVSRYGLVRVRIYDLSHVDIDVAVDAVFDDTSRPRLTDLEARLGKGRQTARNPDDFSSGDRVAFFPRNSGSPAYVRVFAELERSGARVTRLQIDRSIPTPTPGGRRCLRETLADTVDDETDVGAELAYLMDVLGRRHRRSSLNPP